MAITPTNFGISNLRGLNSLSGLNGASLNKPTLNTNGLTNNSGLSFAPGSSLSQTQTKPIARPSNVPTSTIPTQYGFQDGSSYTQGANGAQVQVKAPTLPPLQPTATTAPTTTANPPIVVSSQAAQNDQNAIKTNAANLGNAQQQQNQSVQQQQAAAAQQSQQTQANAQAQQQSNQVDTSNFITTDDLNQALNGSGSLDTSNATPQTQGTPTSAVNTQGTASDVNASNSISPTNTSSTAPNTAPQTPQVSADGLIHNQDGSTTNPQTGITTTTDANGNQIQTVAPTQQDNAGQLNNTIAGIKSGYADQINQDNQQIQQFSSQLGQINQQQISAATNYQNQVNQLMNGTFPLSANDQAQLNYVNTQYNSLIAQAQGDTASLQGGLAAAGAASGRSMYAPEIQLGLVNQAAAAGVQKVADLQSQAADAYAKLDSALQANDLNLIQSSYKATTDALGAASTAVTSMKNDVQDAIKQVYQNQTDDIANAFKSATLTDTEAKNIFDEASTNVNLTDTQKAQIQTAYYQNQDLAIKRQQVAISQEDVGIKLQQLQQTKIGNALIAANAVQKTGGNGYQYVDGTSLTADQQTQLLQSGIPVLNGANAKSMTSINSAEQAASDLHSTFQSIGLMDSNGNFTGKGGQISGLGGTFNRGAANAISSFNSQIQKSITDIQSTGDSKVNGDLLSTLQNNQLKGTDSPAEASKKMTNIANALKNGESSVLSNAATGYSVSTPAGIVTFSSQKQLDDYKNKAGLN